MRNVRYGMVAAFVTGMALFAAGCAGGGADSGKDTNAQGAGVSGKGEAEDDAYKYRQCLRDNGLDVQEPKDGEAVGIQGDDKKLKKAMDACKGLPGAGKELTQEEQEKNLDNAVNFAKCMREQGIDFPDPKLQDGKLTAQRLDNNVSKEKIEKAQKVCGEKNGQ
ncbi:hypothetical protein [Streptomyces sp. x-19]|uniref:hypothetical protein n=1 Tax=Streptomyces sp. x-19 TaxID=2789280 RepID=UPI003980669E